MTSNSSATGSPRMAGQYEKKEPSSDAKKWQVVVVVVHSKITNVVTALVTNFIVNNFL